MGGRRRPAQDGDQLSAQGRCAVWIEEPKKALTAGTIAVFAGCLLIAAGIGVLSSLLPV
jgi:hypothetical protein